MALFQQLPANALMGIVNITPNSFSDPGQFLDVDCAVEQATALATAGAGILDLGAEASSFFRPGVAPVGADEQLERLLPVLKRLPRNVPISIDTRSAYVAAEMLSAGANIINDISAGIYEPQILQVVAQHHAAMILMHIAPNYPATPPHDDPNILANVYACLAQRLAAAQAAGISRDNLAIDPGIGFGKTMSDNWTLALHLHHFADLGVPMVVGISRKRFLETPPPISVQPEWQSRLQAVQALAPADAHPRDAATAALTRFIADRSLSVRLLHRVHHVTLARQALTM